MSTPLIPGLFDVDTIWVVKMTNGSGYETIEINATNLSTAWRYAVQVGVVENRGFYPVTIRSK